MDFFEILACSTPAILALMVTACILHAWAGARKQAGEGRFLKRAVLVCVLHVVIAGAVYRHLIEGGWLTAKFQWNDPDNINLVLAVFEGFCVAAVIALVISKRLFFYKMLVDLLVIQLLLAAVFLSLFLVFMLTWHPKMF